MSILVVVFWLEMVAYDKEILKTKKRTMKIEVIQNLYARLILKFFIMLD